MKKVVSLAFCAALVCLSSGSCDSDKDGFSSISEDFKNPPSEYRTFPFAVWNDEVTEEKVESVLEDFKDAGCGGAIIHPRPGLITEYLSEDWFDLYDFAVEKAKSMGSQIWIYDENSYPSGFAGGHVLQEMPESYNQGQGLVLVKVETLPSDASDYFICLKKEGESWIDITADLGRYQGEKGDYYLYKKTYQPKSDWYGGYSYVDVMVEGVTEKFIDVTMSGYENTLEDEFGKTVMGVFSDEPNIASPGGLRWTQDLFEAFKERWGYDLVAKLPLLQEEEGDWRTVRHNYMETLLELFIERWSKPFHDYCEKKGLVWTGHYWEHGWPDMNEGPDNMAMYAWHQMPGIDMLFNQFNEVSPTAQFGNVRAVKELRSVANQVGQKRTFSETYGGGGWEVTFKDLKRLGDWEYVLGVNFMNQHLSHMTLSGARKYDYPPVFSYHSPWWGDYRMINDYFGRLSLVLAKGEQVNDVLVIEPTTTIWRYYSHTGSNHRLGEVGNAFQAFITRLEKAQVEYDLGSENIIKDYGSVSNGKFVVGNASYSTVVLPPMMENLDKATFDLLREFVADGGKLQAFSSLSCVDGKESGEMAALMSEARAYGELTDDVIEEAFSPFRPEISFKGGNLYHQRRRYSDGELVFLVNSSMDDGVEGSLAIRGKDVVIMDAFSGEIYSYPFVKNGGKAEVAFELEPAGSMLLFFSDKNLDYPGMPVMAGDNKLEASSKTVVKRVRDNVLNVDLCDVTVNGETTEDVYFATAADMAYKAHGFVNGDPWNTSVQYKRNIVDRDNFTDGGFDVSYSFTVNDSFDYSGMRLVCERPDLFEVEVNGQRVSQVAGQWWLDKSFGVYEIGDLVRKGVNRVRLGVHPMSVFAEIQPVYVLGDFSVVPGKEGWSIGKPVESFGLGSWKEQGQPFYSWEFSYSKEYEIEDLSRPYAVKLNDWAGTVCEVYVNGEKAGSIGFDPYRLDVTEALKTGKNQVEVRVIGSHKNLLGPFYGNPAPGLTGPWHWRHSKGQVPAADYQMLDYGLFEDFDLEY